MGDYVLITAALAAAILAVVQGIKALLESPLLVWILKLIGHSEVMPWLAVALSIVTGIAAGIVTYMPDGITVAEIISIIASIIGSWGGHSLVKKASGR